MNIVKRTEELGGSQATAVSKEGSVTDQGKHLLIVEDDPGLQSQLRWCFEDYKVVIA